MSTLDVVAEVLREVAPRALKARQIAALAGDRLPTASRTPETVVSRDLALDVKDRGAASRFLRVDRGAFVLKEALPIAFYNDVEPYAAQWTRNLIEAGELAPGVVDERSIRDLKPTDVASYRQFHAFSGIGIWSRALREAGWPDNVNIWTGSCPCQNFSSAGKREGFAGDLHLWPEWFRLIAACRPAVVVGEQTSSALGRAWLDLVFHDLEGAGYTCRAFDIPACGVGAPHRRQRLYFVAYARGREILSAPWLHARRQSGHDVLGCRAPDGRDAGSVSDAAGARSCVAEDARADRGDARESAEALERGTAGDLELERGGAANDPRGLPDAERVVRDEGRAPLAHGRSEVESDRYGEADGAGRDVDGPVELGGAGLARSQGRVSGTRGWDGATGAGKTHAAVHGSVELGDAGLARGRRDAGEIPRAEGAGEGERIEARNLAHKLIAPGADDCAVDAADRSRGFRPGDRIRIDGDPSWGGAVRGFWATDVEWIYCRPEPGHQDGRWRPVGAGIEPLVAGPSSGVGRTRAKRLRGFGNAIVLPLATTFVSAVIDAFTDAALEVVAVVDSTRTSTSVSLSSGEQPAVSPVWTGPNSGETAPSGMLFGRVPGERWPYGPPSAHEPGCNLFPHRGGSPGGLFCDCAASAADDVEHGVGA